MRRASVLVMGLLALAVVCGAAQAEEASVLLEAGVYAEEVVGDLDKAIETYRQIIGDAEASRRYVAEAHYRLGKCYLAKGDEDKAREQFTHVAERYPDQEAPARSARRELAKLQPAPPGRGQSRRVLVPNVRQDKRGLDLDTGNLVPIPKEPMEAAPGPREAMTILAELGIDIVYENVAILVEGTRAEKEEVDHQGGHEFRILSSSAQTTTVTTREGGRFELTILGADGEGVEIEFQQITPGPGEWTFGPVIELVVRNINERKQCFVDLDSGEVVDWPESGWREITAWCRNSGVDLTAVPNSVEGFSVVLTRLSGVGLGFVEGDPAYWDSAAAVTENRLRELSFAEQKAEDGFVALVTKGNRAPPTFLFETSQGGMGILQIVDFTDEPRGVKIRYKMVQEAKSKTAPAAVRLAASKELLAIGIALAIYEIDTASYPTTEQGLEALIVEPAGATNWRGPYIKATSVPRDPWGNPYYYVFPSTQSPDLYDLTSGGPDGTFGTEDDISNLRAQYGASPSSSALADVRIRLADARAELKAALQRHDTAKTQAQRIRIMAEAGRAEPTDVEEAADAFTEAEARCEAAQEKVKILTEEIARLEAGPKATSGAANAASLADLRLRLADAEAELKTAAVSSASLAGRLKTLEASAAAGQTPQAEVDAAREEMPETLAGISAARKRIDVLKEAIARLEGATVHVPTGLEVSQRFVELLRSGENDAELSWLAEPGEAPDPKAFLPRFRQSFDLSGFMIAEFWLADEDACAVTSVLQPVGEGGRPTALGIGLRKNGDRWLVRDTDALPTEQSRKEFVQEFRDANPSARQVPLQLPPDGP